MEDLVDDECLRWKIVILTQQGVFFSGQDCLEDDPQAAQWFDDFDSAVVRSKDIVEHNLDGVLQIRIISSAFRAFRN